VSRASTNAPKPRVVGRPFKKGNPGGPGNPLARRVYELREAFMRPFTPEIMEGLARKAAQMGLNGDMVALKICLDRLLGAPVQQVVMDGAFVHDFSLFERLREYPEVIKTIEAKVIEGHRKKKNGRAPSNGAAH
jgi:hypothetical protein